MATAPSLAGIHGPVLDLQPLQVPECLVVGDQDRLQAQGMGANQQIHWRKHPALPFSSRLDAFAARCVDLFALCTGGQCVTRPGPDLHGACRNMMYTFHHNGLSPCPRP